MLRNGRVTAERTNQPFARGCRVGHRLKRGEGLRRNDEQCFAGIQVACDLGEVGSIDVGHEAECHRSVAERPQREIGHLRSEIRTADADIHDVADALAGVTEPGTRAHTLGEACHRIEHLVHVGHDVMAVDKNARILRCPQCDMQDGTLFGDVDLVATEHRVTAFGDAALLRELQQQTNRLVRDAVLRIVQIQTRTFDCQAFTTPRIVGEQLPQMHVLDLLVVRLQRVPRRRLVRPLHVCHGGVLRDG